MAKFSLITIISLLYSATAARNAADVGSCCLAQLETCQYQGASACVYYNSNQYCAKQTSDEGCKSGCRSVYNQPSYSNNFYVYEIYRG